MELDLQSVFGLHVHSCTQWLRPPNPHPRSWAHIRGRYCLLVSQDRRHLFVTPWLTLFICELSVHYKIKKNIF